MNPDIFIHIFDGENQAKATYHLDITKSHEEISAEILRYIAYVLLEYKKQVSGVGSA